MQLLFAELKRIEGQQQQLKAAVAQNKVLVVHPPKGFDAVSVEDEYAEEEEVAPNPDRFIPSGECVLSTIYPLIRQTCSVQHRSCPTWTVAFCHMSVCCLHCGSDGSPQ